MDKEVLRGIEGVEIFPVIALVIFVAFFCGLLFWVARTKRSEFDETAALPLDEPTGPAGGGVAGHRLS